MDAVQPDAGDTLRHSRQARSESAADTTASPITSIHSNDPLPWSGLMPVSDSIQSGHCSVSNARTAATVAEMASAQKRGLACCFVTTDLRSEASLLMTQRQETGARYMPAKRPITDEGVASGRGTAAGMMPIAHRAAGPC
jgi:hypothetical protein